jgi:hypothetical protein
MHEQLLSLWPPETQVQACIKQEAEAVDEAVFLAVHQPMSLLRRDVGAAGQVVARTEQDLLQEFLTPHLPEGRLILPIVGSSGVGKSHVIRWLDAQLRRRTDASQRHVIRVPKGSSLKGVLRLLLQHLPGPAFARLREALATARDHLDPERAVSHLQGSLRVRLVQHAKAAALRLVQGRGQPLDPALQTYGDASMLPALLGDPWLEKHHWLRRANGQKGVLALLAEQVTQEGRTDTDTRRHQFVADDLLLADSLDFGEVSGDARRCYQRLHRADAARREDAARVLNAVLDEAKNDLLQLGDQSLVELFGEVRAELGRERRELVLLVEDFAVLSGIQGALLQVIIAEAVRDGQATLCPMRTALAYTEGYLAGRDTVLTRAGSEWLLQDRPGEDADILQRVERLVGAYLNAARVGPEALRHAYPQRPEGGSKDWLPRVDEAMLETPAQAVVRAFGASVDGYPLFPFNRAAIVQLARRASLDTRGQLVFNPRHVIRHVLTPLLLQREHFVRQTFPPPSLGAEELRSAELISALGRQVQGADLPRYLAFFRLWGDQPDSVAQAALVPPALYEAFSLPVLGWTTGGLAPAALPPTGGPPPTAARPERAAPERPVSAPADGVSEDAGWSKTLQDWVTGTRLGQQPARELRGWVAQALDAYLPTDVLLFKPREKLSDNLKQVYLPRAQGQAGLRPQDAWVVVAEDAVLDEPLGRAHLVRTLMAFARRYGIYRTWNYPGAEVDGGLLRDFLEQQAPRLLERWRQPGGAMEMDTRPGLVRGLLVGARVLGLPGAHDRASLPELMAAMLADAPSLSQAAAKEPWAELQGAFAQVRSVWREALLEEVGARQGGAPLVHALDVVTLAPMVRELKGDWTMGPPWSSAPQDPGYQRCARPFQDLRVQLDKTVRDEQQRLMDWLPEVQAWWGEAIDKTQVQQALRDLLAEVKKRGLVPADYEALRREVSELGTVPLVAAVEAAQALTQQPSRGEVLSLLAQGPGRAVEPVRRLMARMEAFWSQLERTLKAQEVGAEGELLQSALNGVEEELTALHVLLQPQGEEAS